MQHNMRNYEESVLDSRPAEAAASAAPIDYQLRILHGLWFYESQIADFDSSLATAQVYEAVAVAVDVVSTILTKVRRSLMSLSMSTT